MQVRQTVLGSTSAQRHLRILADESRLEPLAVRLARWHPRKALRRNTHLTVFLSASLNLISLPRQPSRHQKN